MNPAGEVARLRPAAESLTGCLHELLPATARGSSINGAGRLVDSGSAVQLAHNVSVLRPLSTVLDMMIKAAHVTGADLTCLATVYLALGERLDLDWLRTRLADQGTDSR